MSDPQEAATPHENVVFDRLMQSKREFTAPLVSATPSDPHSAEAEAEYPYNSLYPDAITNAMRHSFDAGRVSRDAEVAELKAKIADAVPVVPTEYTPTAKEIEAAARAMFEVPASGDYTWDEMVSEDASRADLWRADACSVLVAANPYRSASSPVEGGSEARGSGS